LDSAPQRSEAKRGERPLVDELAAEHALLVGHGNEGLTPVVGHLTGKQLGLDAIPIRNVTGVEEHTQVAGLTRIERDTLEVIEADGEDREDPQAPLLVDVAGEDVSAAEDLTVLVHQQGGLETQVPAGPLKVGRVEVDADIVDHKVVAVFVHGREVHGQHVGGVVGHGFGRASIGQFDAELVADHLGTDDPLMHPGVDFELAARSIVVTDPLGVTALLHVLLGQLGDVDLLRSAARTQEQIANDAQAGDDDHDAGHHDSDTFDGPRVLGRGVLSGHASSLPRRAENAGMAVKSAREGGWDRE
jgi:hypothetical protein